MYTLLKEKIQNIIQNKEQQYIDYIGINIDSHKNKKYKIYYYDKCKSNKALTQKQKISSIIEKLKNKGLIKVENPVDDDNNTEISRFELSIKAKKDKDILELINILSEQSKLIKSNINEIMYLSKMQVFPNTDMHFVAMYYLGLIQEQEEIKATKFHFMTRKEINYKTVYDNKYYIEYLKKLNKNELNILIELLEQLLNKNIGNLHLMGVDYFVNKPNKYKIYFKINNHSIKNITKEIKNLNIKDDISNITQELIKVEQFVTEIPQLQIEIIALCYEKEKGFSINLYFKLY